MKVAAASEAVGAGASVALGMVARRLTPPGCAMSSIARSQERSPSADVFTILHNLFNVRLIENVLKTCCEI